MLIDTKAMQDKDLFNLAQDKMVEDKTNGENYGSEEQALLFLDSLDDYLVLLDSLSSTLRQGWLELASARHSMGSSRVSSTLLDLNVQSAATKVMLNEPVERSSSAPQPHFTLSKWAYSEEQSRSSSPLEVVDGMFLKDHSISELRHRGSKHAPVDANLRALSPSEEFSVPSKSTVVDEHKQRYKAVSVFGAFVSPKLRATQVSFETALETIVEIANARSSMLSAFSQLQKDGEASD